VSGNEPDIPVVKFKKPRTPPRLAQETRDQLANPHRWSASSAPAAGLAVSSGGRDHRATDEMQRLRCPICPFRMEEM
jgi:hypothetical protein